MKSSIPFILFLFLFINGHSAESDTVIFFRDLKFNSLYEENAFRKVPDLSKSESLDLFLNNYKDDTINRDDIQKKINETVNYLEPEIKDKSESKIVKLIYQHIHDKFFKVYALENSFTDIFKDGSYNCVSATALYALVFSRLNIPFNVRETPVHVYLEVFPATSKVLLETTIPTGGIYSFTNDFKKQYVQSLYTSKQISKSDFDNSNTENLFDKYYFSSDGISLLQLAGLQYSNYALYQLDKKQYNKAVDNFMKAQYLYPCKRHEYFLKYSLQLLQSNTEYTNMDEVRMFGILCRFNNPDDGEISNEVIRQESNRIINQFLVNESNVKKTDSAYGIIASNISDSVLLSHISFNYHYEMSRFSINSFKDSAMVAGHLRSAYAINPNNADLHKLVLLYFLKCLQKSDEISKALLFMNDLTVTFPFLKEDDTFNSAYAQCYLELSYRSYMMQNSKEGDDYLTRFEKINPDNKLSSVDNKFIEKAYTTAAGYYFKKGNTSRSKSIVQKGLFYVPDSFLLKQMSRQF